MTPDKAKSLANDISCAIATLQSIADELATAYPDSDYAHDAELKPPPEPTPKPKTKTKTEKPATTEDDVRRVLAAKSRDGFTAQVKALITKYGAPKVSELDPAHYEAVIAEAEEIKG
jgi:hypothetical protein